MSVLAARCARLLACPALAAVLGSGCIGLRVVYPVQPTGEELREFEAAGPADLQVQQLEVASMQVGGPYHVVGGDLLAIELPAEVDLGAAKSEGNPAVVTYKVRVKEESGVVVLPMVGEIRVAGQTTGEIEQTLAAAYDHPERLATRPNVVVTVSEYRTVSVAVTGAVNQPGLHELRSDHMTVFGALMEAGGIKGERGAKEIRVLRQEDGATVVRSLSVLLADIPLSDVGLRGGETIVVEPAPERAFTVIGLVKKSGVFDYPAPRVYNLMQALATAGGVDETAAPRWATIYRVKADGKVIGATFRIDGTTLLDASNVRVKDGDVIAVEHTQGSWMRQFFSQVLGFRASATVGTSTTTL
jgi:protein involved in polysaccharide export with SLBB domain